MPIAHCGFIGEPDALVRLGPALLVDIGLDSSFSPSSGIPPNLARTQVPALVDTGAMINCIDSALARELGLPIINRRDVSGIHGSMPTNMHLAHLYIPSLNAVIRGQFAGVHLAAGGQPHVALIDRTSLRHFTITYNGVTGAVTVEN